MSARRYGPAVLGLLLGAGLLYLALRDIRLPELGRLIHSARPAWLPLMAAMAVLDLFVRALRWRLLLLPIQRVPAGLLFRMETIGLAINNLLFMRLGELARATLTGASTRIPLLSVLSTIVVERVCDTAALLVFFALSARRLEGVDARLGPLALALAAALAALLLGAGRLLEALERWPRWMAFGARYPRLARAAAELALGARALHSWRAALPIALLSFGLWASDAGLYWAAGRALELEPALGYFQSVTVLAVAAAASAIPALPGAFGSFEAFVKTILVRFGYDAQLAFAYATLVHLCMYLVVTSLGVFFLYRLGHTFAGLLRALRGESA